MEELNKIRTRFFFPSVLIVTSLLTLTGCPFDSDSKNKSADSDDIKIEYTSYGVPHITASNRKYLAYGQAYAHAKDNMCTTAEEIINVRSKRALTFGAGENDSNINSDFGVLALGLYQQSEAFLEEGITDLHLGILQGYANGFNKAVADKGSADNYPSPCRGASWIPEITPVDLHAYHLRLAVFASGSAFTDSIATAAPPVQNVNLAADVQAAYAKIEHLGSNGWALGRDKTESGKGMLLTNVHFPWSGNLRFIETHLKVPGELNVTGASLAGVPGILMGFNEDIAWTHTVSQSKRFTIYNLTLDPDDATRYVYGTGFRDITSTNYSISVMNEDETVSDVQKTLYFSHYGPMLGWNPNGTALTYRDANVENHNMVLQWFAMAAATTIEEFDTAFETYQGIPWVNTLATDQQGNAFFIDGSRAPNLNPIAESLIADFLTNDPTGQFFWQEGKGQIVMDGSQPILEWLDTGNTPIPGLVPYEDAPKLQRSDYVFNANSSHWLNNVQAPLEGYSIVYGPERTIRKPRTRMSATMLEEVSAEGNSGIDGKFNLEELKSVVTSQRGFTSELFKDDVVSRCNGVTDITLPDTEVIDISTACTILSNWDGLYRNDSIGAHVFREFLNNFNVRGERILSAELFTTPFDRQQPVNTPTGLRPIEEGVATNDDPILQSLAIAVQRLAVFEIALDARLGDLQYHMKNDERLPIPGGAAVDGVFNINSSGDISTSNNGESEVTADGYPVAFGASWLMALEFTETGPKAEGLIVYGQSHDPESENYVDQTRLFSEGSWRPIIFTKQEIASDLVETINLSGN